MTVDLLTPAAVADPYAAFARLRQQAPTVWSETHKAWVVTRYSGVRDGFADATRLSSDRLTPYWRRLTPERADKLGTTFELLRGWMVFHDAPIHAALRDPVRKAFTPRQLERLRPKIETIAEELLDAMAERGEGDFKAEVAFPLPALAIAELMGVQGGARDQFKNWSAKLAAIVFGESDNPDRDERAAEGAAEFIEFFSWLIQRRRQEPGDDLVSALLAAIGDPATVGGVAGTDHSGPLTDLRLIGACTLMLFAGHETTTNLLSNSALTLMRHPEQSRLLLDRPELTDLAVEELLRFDGPVKIMVRAVREDHERDGVRMRQGETVYLAVASAQRDPQAWDRPDELLLDRPSDRTRPGMAFGQGAHFCLGAALARLEARIAIPAALRRFPKMRLLTDDVDWEAQILGRTMTGMQVSVHG
ncbi:MAG TPA: cytochrome P450 [Pseudonocardia sp.]|nr:cytochrome P450 [Pseudonocardia sp.]